MNKVHIVMQGRGGVGKSYIASVIVLYYMEKNLPCLTIDIDLVERIVSSDSHFVVDNGASPFVTLAYHLMENNTINVLINAGKAVIAGVIHLLRQTSKAFGMAIEKMLERRITFQEFRTSEDFHHMVNPVFIALNPRLSIGWRR